MEKFGFNNAAMGLKGAAVMASGADLDQTAPSPRL